MKVLNKENLPELLYNALAENRPPVEGEIHVTQLIGPPLIDYLKRKHWDELVDDASNRLFALLGTGLHAGIANDGRIEHAKRILDDMIKEWSRGGMGSIETIFEILKDLFKSLDSVGRTGIESQLKLELSDKWTLVGTDDHFDEDTGKEMDWKITSVWNVLFGDHNWEEQLNVYAYMRRKLGYEVKSLEVWALLRDWEKSKAKYDNDPKYPRVPFARIALRSWSLDEQEDYIYKRLPLFDGTPGECTPEEKWESPTVYKVMKKNRKSALIATRWIKNEKKDLLSIADAIAAAGAKNHVVDGTNIYIEKFEGKCRRCQDYCVVHPFCKYYKVGKGEYNG
ncbi:hypothetical protein LCGC14_1408860 [marine sediment metagenome]|uniref:PD-(D/E)XK endonuclease-like domain-containing protein n=1 Tax=marine sediment metagenome TaxID=412755 RepID=A0A0F9KFT4_9ZZZZ